MSFNRKTVYNIGESSQPRSAYSAPSSPTSALQSLRQFSDQTEKRLNDAAEPFKQYMPFMGRFLIVVTFIEDALRIVTQWSDQLTYLRDYRNIPSGLTHLFLIFNVVTMSVASATIIANAKGQLVTRAAYALMAVVFIQGVGYGLIFDLNFFLRNLSVVGGLVLISSDSFVRKSLASAGLPSLDDPHAGRSRIQLLGRILLILMVLGFVFTGEWSFWRLIVSLIGIAAASMVVVGFKARGSATLLVVIFSIFNISVNNFWTLHPHHPHKDFAKYDFFQILSIVGGLLLLIDVGPGALSLDEKHKKSH